MPNVGRPDNVRAQALILVAQGKRTDAVAQAVGVAPETVRKWLEAARSKGRPPQEGSDLLEDCLADARIAMRIATEAVESGDEDPMLVAKILAMITPALKHQADRKDRMVGVADEIERLAAPHITTEDPEYDDIHSEPDLSNLPADDES